MGKSTKPMAAPEGAYGWTVEQFAARYQVNRSTVYNWMSSGHLASAKLSGARRILPEHDQAFRARSQSEAA
ncbi:MAG: helix-turn-helix domain-containing protein [Xanthomonadales bacterium]|nr:helix-turn-helix domain-containing protein [Xanthomonadales bacterium]